jgi:hypothetical protein
MLSFVQDEVTGVIKFHLACCTESLNAAMAAAVFAAEFFRRLGSEDAN